MTVRRIDEHRKPDFNEQSRRALLLAAIAAQADDQPNWAHADGDRLAVLMERVGDVAAAYNNGHVDIEGELQRAAGTILAWLERFERGRAA